MVETSFGYLFVCVTAPPVVALPPWRVVVLHVFSASRFLTRMITQLPLFTLSLDSLLFAGCPFSILPLFGNYLVLFLCGPCPSEFYHLQLSSSLSTHKPHGSSVHCISRATIRFILCWTLLFPVPPAWHVHTVSTPPHPPHPCWRSSTLAFNYLVSVSPSLVCIACGNVRWTDG